MYECHTNSKPKEQDWPMTRFQVPLKRKSSDENICSSIQKSRRRGRVSPRTTERERLEPQIARKYTHSEQTAMAQQRTTIPLKTGLVGGESTGVQSSQRNPKELRRRNMKQAELPNTTSGSPSLDGGPDHRRASPSPKTKTGQQKVTIGATNKERLRLAYETS